MRSLRSALVNLAFSLSALTVCATRTLGAPYRGDILTLQQPDKSLVQVRVFGDEFYHRIESLDGYTLTQDPKTRWIEYARLNPAGTEFVSTAVRYRSEARGTSRGQSVVSTAPAGLSKALDLKRDLRIERAKANRDLLGKGKPPRIGQAALPGPGGQGQGAAALAAPAPTVGPVKGLTLLIDFADDVASVPQTKIENYLNQVGYAEDGMNGSVRDYFRGVSGNALDYTNHVTAYYRALYPKTHYTDPEIGYGQRARELIREALVALDAQGFDFSTLSVDEHKNIRAINMFYAGYIQNAWAQGLWPHMSGMYGEFSADGVNAGVYQITNIGSYPTLGTFCHENGHMLMGWADLYDYDGNSIGVGDYCLMAYQGPWNNPVPPNAYFRWNVGWDQVTDIPAGTQGTLVHTANSNTSFRYTNPAREGEWFFIESRVRTGRNEGLPDEGLLIWHVDQYGSNSWEQMTPEQHYHVSVEQADGRFDLERNTSWGGEGDLFHAGYKAEFADWTLPDSRWWSGATSGLNIVDIGPVGTTMSFSVEPGGLRTANVGNPAIPGTLSESDGTVTMEGSGADIWGTADQFYYRYSSLPADGDVIARIQSLENTNPWAKAGVMLRETLEAGSRNVFLAVTPANGTTFQQRLATGATTATAEIPGTAPRWLRLTRRGTTVQGYVSADGQTWTAFGSATLSVTGSLYAGLAVTSHTNATLATVVATDVQVVPAAFSATDIGGATPAGSWSQDNTTLTVRGGGADIWNTSDQFYFMHQAFSGDVRILARVNSLVQTDPWAKAGLMLRSSLDANAPNVFVGITPANGAVFQRRTAAGAATTDVAHSGITAPRWLVLESRGGVFKGFRSDNGATWTEIGRETAAINPAFVGLAVTSHNPSTATTAVFDQVTVQRDFPILFVASSNFREEVGNMDGWINPGEEVALDVHVGNYGQEAAKGVTATLTFTEPCFTLLSNQGTFGEIPVNGQSATSQTYRFRVGTGCTGGPHAATLEMTDAFGDRWNAPINVFVMVRSTLTGFVRSPAGPAPAGAYVVCSIYRTSYWGAVQPDGSYTVADIQPGTFSCVAYAPDYPGTTPVSLTFPPSRTQDFVLSRARIQTSRNNFAETLEPGQTRAVGFNITNPGDATLTWAASNPQAGYLWIDSDSQGGPAYAWTDIRTTGTRLTFDQGMSGAVALRTLGFAFPFYGTPQTTLVIARHGYVSFADHYPLMYNSALPQGPRIGGMIAGFWDEIGPNSTAGAVYFQEFPDRVVIQYDQVPRETGTGTYTFQIVLQRDGGIRFYYQNMNEVAGATVGIQHPAADRWINIVNNDAYVKNNLAVELRPLTREWMTVTPASGNTAPSGSSDLTVTFDATGLSAGTYRTEIQITHNESFKLPLSLPVALTVSGAPTGGLRREVWTGIAGVAVSALTSNANFPRNPNVTGTVAAFESPQNYGDNYGQRLRGYITPPTSGDYTFFIAGDDNCELRLSTDDHPGRAALIARVPDWTAHREWAKYPEQRSAAIRLEAGKKYFVEVLHKEGGSGDHVSVGWQGPGITGETERPIPSSRLTPFDPATLIGLDIGNPGHVGSNTVSGGVHTLVASGADIWGSADQFRFVYQPLVGDGEITARVASIQNTDGWAKAGVMIRESLAADARHAYTAVTAVNGLAFQRRTATGGQSLHTGVSGGAPRWVRLRRAGNVFTAFVSTDGTTWTQVGSETIAMGPAAYMGLAVTSHNNAALCTATLDSLTIR